MNNDPEDVPETFIQYVRRHAQNWPDHFNGQDIEDHVKQYWKPDWLNQERQKSARRKQKAIADRERIAVQRTQERQERELQRDPIPAFKPRDFPIRITRDVRSRHIFMPGASGNGKSSQMLRIIAGDIKQGHAVVVLDPKGDLIRRLCALLRPEHLAKCIYLDIDHPVPLDILGKSGNPEYLVKDIRNIITKGNESLVQAGPKLSKLIYCLCQLEDSSFLDIEYFFTRKERQSQILTALLNLPNKKWYEIAKADLVPMAFNHYSPITGRMGEFTLSTTLETIIGHPRPVLNIAEVIKENKIILVNLAGMGEPRDIFGSLVLSLYQQAALLRASSDPRYFIPEGKRPPICFFVDEFEDFQTPSFAELYSKARGLGLHVTLGVQYLAQLDTENKHSILTNSASNIIFHQEEELDAFANKIHPYKPYRLGLLKQFQAAFKIGDEPVVFKWTKAPPRYEDAENAKSEQVIAQLVQQTQNDYGWDACDRAMKAATSAQSGTIRAGDKSPSNSAPVRHDEVNGNSTPQDQPSGSQSPRGVPFDPGKKRNPRNPR